MVLLYPECYKKQKGSQYWDGYDKNDPGHKTVWIDEMSVETLRTLTGNRVVWYCCILNATSYGKKKSVVYVTDGDKVKRVTFGDPNMRIKKNQKGRRSNFRARHNCENPGPKTKARYWSCKAW